MIKLKLIVSYRDREEHKKIFVDRMYEFLSNSNPDSFRIYIVEQCDVKEFNKGCLLNIWFLETGNDDNCYYCFSDIDTLPKSSSAKYTKPPENTIVHPYGHFHCLSNIILINRDTFQKMNGFSIKYWFWRFEDNDFMLRAKVKNVTILRNNFSKRFKSNTYNELDSQKIGDLNNKMNRLSSQVNELLFYNTILNPAMIDKDGLSTTKNEVTQKLEFEKYTLLKCKIKNCNRNLEYIDALNEYSSFLKSIC